MNGQVTKKYIDHLINRLKLINMILKKFFILIS